MSVIRLFNSLSIIVLFVLFLIVLGCKSDKHSANKLAAPVPKEVLSAPTLLATINDNEKPDTMVVDQKHSPKPGDDKTQPHIVVEINKNGRGYAYIARVEKGVHVAHNGKVGKSYDAVDSSTLSLSPDGQRVAYGAKSGDKWYVVVDEKEYGPFDDKGPPVFSPDSAHVAFEVKKGNFWFLHIDQLISTAVPSFFDKPVFNNDSNRVLRFESDEKEIEFRVIYSSLTFEPIQTFVFHNINKVVDQLNTKVAFIDKVEGKYQVKVIDLKNPSQISAGPKYDMIRNVSFSADSRHMAYLAQNKSKNYLVLDDKEALIPDGLYPWSPVIRPDNKGAGIIVVDDRGASMHQAFYDDKVRAPRLYKECADLVYSNDGKHHAYVAIKNEQFYIVANGIEGPAFDRVISPVYSPDGKYLVYRARKDGKRFVIVADNTGKILRQHSGYERVFETTFTADGKSVAYGVKDGNQLLWKVEQLP